MKTRHFLSMMLILVCTATPSFGKGPKTSSSSASKYQNKGGYSGMATSKSSKYQRSSSSSSTSRLPTQPTISKKYGSSTSKRYGASSSTPQRSKPSYTPSASSKPTRYTTVRPTYSTKRPTAQAPSSSRPVTSSRPSSSPIRFPSHPTSQPTRISSGYKTKTPTVSQQHPPIVFHPSSNKKPSFETSASSNNPRKPVVQQPTVTRQPIQPSTTRPSRYPTSTLRPPSYRPNVTNNSIVVNQPTHINRTTTNIHNTINNTNISNNTRTNIIYNKNNVNNWYNNNHWQNQVTINSNHWNGRPWWSQPDYGDWHHGHWHGHYGQNSNGRNDWHHVDTAQHAWLNGLAAWGLGNMIYRTGYQFYSNPYRVQPILIAGTTIDYARPITVQYSSYERAYQNDEEKAAQLRSLALRYYEAARRAYYSRDFNTAFDNINRGISLMPDDTSMHEFRALVLFAYGRYREAAETIHAVLAVAPGWDWTTLSGLYENNNHYAIQLLALETYVKLHPQESDARFLLAYHYITLGHTENAVAQLRVVVQQNAGDKLAVDLLTLLTTEEGQPTQLPNNLHPPTLAELQGEWKARRPEGKIELDIKQDQFAWDYDLEENDAEFKGKFYLAQDVLVLATEDGSQMVGKVNMINDNEFTFRLIGSTDNDEGLVFDRD